MARSETSDFLHSLGAAVQELRASEQVLVHLLVRPARREMKQAIYAAITEVAPPNDQYEALARMIQGDDNAPRQPRFEARRYRPLEERLRETAFEVLPILCVAGDDRQRLYRKVQRLESAFRSLANAGYGGFRLGPWGWGASARTVPTAWPAGVTGHYLTVSELGLVWHPISNMVRAPGVERLKRGHQPLPTAVAQARGLVVGRHNQPGKERFVRIPDADFRAGPTLYCGRSGMGKTVGLAGLIGQLSALPSQPTIIVLDPHSDLTTTTILQTLSPQREKDTYYFDCADTQFPFSLNPLLRPAGLAEDVHSQHVFALISSLFADVALHARMQDGLYAGLATLCAQEAATILDLERLYLDSAFRQQALRRVTDPLTLAFWQRYERLSPSYQLERTEPLIYRIRALSRSPAVRNLTCQKRPLNLTKLIDQGSVLLFGLAGEAVKAEADTIGNLVITALHMALTTRLNRPPNERRPVVLVVDETQRFQASSLISLHTEARKTGLSVVTATQLLDRWSDELRQAVLGNLSTLVAFKSNPEDARRLSAFIAPYTPQDLLTLDRYEALVSLHVHDQLQPAIDVRTIPIDQPENHARLERVREQTRRRFCRPRAEVEAELLTHLAPAPASPTPRRASLPPIWTREDVEEE